VLWPIGLALCIAYLFLTWPVLPPRIPAFFAVAGEEGGSWLPRGLFVTAAVGGLVVLNGVLAFGVFLLVAGRGGSRLWVPWRNYWSASSHRRSEALSRLRDVMIVGGVLTNAVWLLGYHLVMQEVGRELWVAIPPEFGAYVMLVGVLVFVYGTVNYFRCGSAHRPGG
jgi:hypothetical protein